MTKDKIIIEVYVEDAQELAYSAETKAYQIDWTLENKRLDEKKAKELDGRAKKLMRAASVIKKALHARAKIMAE